MFYLRVDDHQMLNATSQNRQFLSPLRHPLILLLSYIIYLEAVKAPFLKSKIEMSPLAKQFKVL